jgi:hypothetical protein
VKHAVYLICVLGTAAVAGCVASQMHTSASPPWPPTSQPAGGAQTVASTAAQTGLITTALQGLTGINYQQALPWGFIPLMAWQTLLSHRREMARITAGGGATKTPAGGPTGRGETCACRALRGQPDSTESPSPKQPNP